MGLLRRRSAISTEAPVDEHGATSIAALQPRQHVTVVGQVVHMRALPTSGLPSLLVTLSDGTGTLAVRWSGRRAIGGVGLGRRLRLEGLTVEGQGRLELVNPVYTLLP